jgi:hypothetical protein
MRRGGGASDLGVKNDADVWSEVKGRSLRSWPPTFVMQGPQAPPLSRVPERGWAAT